MHEIIPIIEMIILLVSIFFCLTTISNLLTFKKPHKELIQKLQPSVDILIPSRNEEKSISKCLDSLLKQTYSNMNILVLDDQSTDNTASIVKNYVTKHNHVKLIKGKNIPEGWLGKNWACQQLGEIASSDLILFSDADTCFEKDLIENTINLITNKQIDFITLIPRRETQSIFVKITLSFIDWFIIACLPKIVCEKLSFQSLSIAFGQFMLIKRKTYEKIKGHETFKNSAVDDIELGRLVKKEHFSWRIYNGTNAVRTTMYKNTKELTEGLTKNIYPSFGYHITLFLITWIIVALISMMPLLSILINFLQLTDDLFSYPLSIISILLMFSTWIVSLSINSQSKWLAFTYPISFGMILYLGLKSLFLCISGKTTWKNRTLTKHPNHFF
jgi:chlorobactene glucosyltransferase